MTEAEFKDTVAENLGIKPSVTERFNRYVRKTSEGCWGWGGYRDNNGYGRLTIDGSGRLAHRLSWEIHCGPLLPGQHVLHRCDNPQCANPRHLFLGDQAANMADKMAKGRHRYVVKRGEEHGCAKLSEDQVHTIRRYTGPASILAREFGVTAVMVNKIRRGAAWKHVA